MVKYTGIGLCFRGVMPFAQRKRLLEKARSRKKKSKEATAAANSDIVVGSMVSVKKEV